MRLDLLLLTLAVVSAALVVAGPSALQAQDSQTESEFPRPQPLEDPRELLELPGVDDDIGPYLRFPHPRPPGEINQLAVSDRQACGLTRDGMLYCWEYDDPETVRATAGLMVAVTAGHRHVCGLDATARPVCWGPNDPQAGAPDTPLSDIAAGADHTCGVDTTGTLFCWGDRLDAQHRNPPDGPFQHIAAGGDLTCATGPWEPSRCWGSDAVSSQPFDQPVRQLSVSSTTVCGIDAANRPVCDTGGRAPAGEPPAPVARDIAAGQNFVCTLDQTGRIECDGTNVPALPESPPLARQIDTSEQTLCAVTAFNTVHCWNSTGQVLGD